MDGYRHGVAIDALEKKVDELHTRVALLERQQEELIHMIDKLGGLVERLLIIVEDKQ